MRYVKQTAAGAVEEYAGNPKLNSTMLAAGWLPYAGTLPLSRLSIIDGAVVELPEPEPAEEWYPRGVTVQAILSLIPEEQRQAVASSWETLFYIAQLTDEVNILDPRVVEFGQGLGITAEMLRTAIAALQEVTA